MQIEVAAATAAEFGASLHGSPYAGTVAATHVLSQAATTDDVVAALLDDVITGSKLCGYGRLADDGVTARNVDGLPGAEALVLHDPASDEFVVLIDDTSWAVDRPSNRFDVTRDAADLTVDTSLGRRVGPSPTAHLLFGLLLAADALGGTSRVLDQTVAYARDRIAFGKPIGGFQAVQHRLADHAVRVRGMSLLVRAAAVALSADDADGTDATRAVVLAEASVSTAASHILHDLLQLTGAIGFTWEYGLHFFQRRVHQDARLSSNPRRALHDLAVLEGWTDVR